MYGSIEGYRFWIRSLKGQCHEIFDIFLFHESNPFGPPDKQAKMVLLKIRFRGDIREKFDTAQANTAQSRGVRIFFFEHRAD